MTHQTRFAVGPFLDGLQEHNFFTVNKQWMLHQLLLKVVIDQKTDQYIHSVGAP